MINTLFTIFIKIQECFDKAKATNYHIHQISKFKCKYRSLWMLENWKNYILFVMFNRCIILCNSDGTFYYFNN